MKESLLVFTLIKVIGTFYLLFLAWQIFSQPAVFIKTQGIRKTGAWKAYRNGVLTNLLNPKVGIFFLTFLPQFVSLNKGSVQLQFLSLGCFFVISGTIINLGYALLISRFQGFIFDSRISQNIINKLTGLIFCILAYKVLVAEQK